MDRLKLILISGLGSGFAPFATGTWGSLVALVLYAIGAIGLHAAVAPVLSLEIVTIAAALGAALIGIALGDYAVRRFGEDPKQFTLDELSGQWVALAIAPVTAHDGWWALAAFAMGQFFLFRFFDIAKIAPARQAEHLPGGWGITLDDIIAGIYANIAGQLIWRVSPAATLLFGHALGA